MNQSVKKHLLQAPIVNGDSFYKVFAKNLLWYTWKLFSVEEWRGYAVRFSLSISRLKRPFSPVFFEANKILSSLWNAILPHQFFNAFSVIQFKYEFFLACVFLIVRVSTEIYGQYYCWIWIHIFCFRPVLTCSKWINNRSTRNTFDYLQPARYLQR